MNFSLFTRTRLKLTFWYLLITMAITGSISFLTYIRSSQFLDFQAQRLEHRYQREMRGFMPPRPAPAAFLDPADFEAEKRQLAIQLALINLGIATFIALSGYFLSGLALKPVKQAMRQQKQFITDAAHELKTPVTALKTSLEVNLMDKKISTQTKKLLKENLEDVQRLELLTHSLLKLSRITASQSSRTQKINIADTAAEAIRSLQSLAKKKQIDLHQNLKYAASVRAQKEIILELILILLDNAIKYSPPHSSVTITITRSSKWAELKVKDEGRGIKAADLPHIFNRFYRADASRSKNEVEGYGLGLSMAQKIVEDLQGKITVSSRLGKGSLFTVKLPLAS